MQIYEGLYAPKQQFNATICNCWSTPTSPERANPLDPPCCNGFPSKMELDYTSIPCTHQHVLFAGLNPFFQVHPWHTHTGDYSSRCLKELPAELGCGADSPALQGAWHHRASYHLHCRHLTTFTPLLQGGEGGQVLLVGYAHHSLEDRAGAGVPAPLPLLVTLARQGIGLC